MPDRGANLGYQIGKRLRELRQQKGLTQKALAGKIKGKIDQSYIGKIERGEQLPSIKILMRISETFSIPIGYFFQEEAGLTGIAIKQENLIQIEELRQRRLITKALQKVHRDDVPLLIEIINILYKHRGKRVKPKLKAGVLGVRERPGEYGMEEPSREDLLFAEHFIQKILAGEKGAFSLEEKDLRKALQIALAQLSKGLEDKG
ncbi:MAG: hypothetical protein A3G93_07470 [Nitrospinae bacterium RIFCSPLOWO2_12_FULL_45_22]|nr:MAG: hypothetical protein A3G93_07470 [Nitrospinae bacterium RIFCSPLOWO2_12_FULL_45_22]